MVNLLNTLKTLRTHWKKSTIGAIALSYAINSAKNKYDTNVFMEACCKEAEKYGEELLPVIANPRSVTIILNPAANKKSAKDDYEKYCEPLLHLAGISVNLIQTNAEGHAKELVSGLAQNEPVIIAGGDGTISEVITGILRQDENKISRTIGVLPLGRRNMFGNELFPVGNKLAHVKQLTDATMAIIKNESEQKNVMKVEVLKKEEDQSNKPIYAVGALEWGAFRDAYVKRDKYWIYGGLREYATYIFNGYKNSLSWNLEGKLKFSPPCNGCNKCKSNVTSDPKGYRLLDFVMPKIKNDDADFSQISNTLCDSVNEHEFKTCEVTIHLEKNKLSAPPQLVVSLGKSKISYFDFVSDGFQRVNKNPILADQIIRARTVEILPEEVSNETKEIFYAIDNEEFDVKPIKITVLPYAIRVFCNKL